MRIRTRGGTEGIYGAVDKEALPVLLGNLRPLVIGQHALAVERIWDQMYRSNRHSRASHYMMAISYVDNALWDLRGRAVRRAGVPLVRRPDADAGAGIWQLPRLLDRPTAGGQSAPRN